MNEKKAITVLYVDDEEINLYIFKNSFSHKYSVITASSGEEGLAKLSDHQNDIIVVISDMRMPQMNGVEFITEARKIHDHIFYFILTGFEYSNEIKSAIENKIVQKFFTKPFDIEEISQTIEDAVNQINEE